MTVARTSCPDRLALLSAALIAGYQRHVSPRKGFGCAVRVRRGELPCSEFAKRAILRRGLRGAVPIVRRRLRLCAQTAKEPVPIDYERKLPPGKRPKESVRDGAKDVCAGDWACVACDVGGGCCFDPPW